MTGMMSLHKIDKLVDPKTHTYGSKIEMDASVKNEIRNDNCITILPETEPTVLINHVRASLKKLMIEKGICYLRAGDSKGSVLVTSGFERMQYVLLHTNGEEPCLFKLKKKGSFNIWTKENLEQIGFSPENSSYYIVLKFDNIHSLSIKKIPDLREGKNTYMAKIKKLSDFGL